jgi:hypothetical protein
MIANPCIDRLRAVCRFMGAKVIQFNLFKTPNAPIDAIHLTITLISTRVYLLILCLSITNIAIFTALRIQMQTVTIQLPTLETYQILHSTYPISLQCQCSQIAVRYGSFVTLSPQYHPVCSSLYVSISWINSIVGTINLDFSYSYTDFHMAGQAFFTTIAALCSLAQSTISDTWFIFNTSMIITDQVLPNQTLMARTSILLDQFQLNTVAEFKRALLLIRWQTQTLFSITRGNADLYTTQLINSSRQVRLLRIPFLLLESNAVKIQTSKYTNIF